MHSYIYGPSLSLVLWERGTAGKHMEGEASMEQGRYEEPQQAVQLVAWADELRAMAAIGQLYGHDSYDLERYQRLAEIATEMLAGATGLPSPDVQALLARDLGYVTVKVGVATAVFDQRGHQLLVRRRDNGLWAMAGGWADIGDSPAAMAAREVREETGTEVRVERLLGLYDSRSRGFAHAHHIYHLVFLARWIGGEPVVTPETQDVGWFGPGEPLPPCSPGHQQAVADAFLSWADPTRPAIFD